ncbi:protein SOB FIVE-LIKE 5-like isoform X2 [Zingiber officinale]|nr:protein SOB FIVE-LIKE 5-like isoform X2 [Zingiber officinale]
MTMEEEEVVEGVISSEHYSSGSCQSGWTAYLDHQSWPCHHSLLLCDKNSVSSSSSFFSFFCSHVHPRQEQEQEQEEDMSMVSDASSRPPQLHRAIHRHDDDGRKRRAEADRQKGCSSSLLEDTASSQLKRKKMRYLESFPAMKPTARP